MVRIDNSRTELEQQICNLIFDRVPTQGYCSACDREVDEVIVDPTLEGQFISRFDQEEWTRLVGEIVELILKPIRDQAEQLVETLDNSV